MKLIGLTGGIGSGKTTALNKFRELGVPCFIADDEAKKLYNIPSFCIELAKHFGDNILDDNGLVNKKELAKIVFSNQDALNTLNGLIHPKVRQMFRDWCKKIESSNKNTPYIIIESAILYETGLNKLLDGVIVVYLEKEERIKRAMLRDNATREQIESRINKQMPDEEKLNLADFLILNYEGNPLDKQVEIINRILQ